MKRTPLIMAAALAAQTAMAAPKAERDDKRIDQDAYDMVDWMEEAIPSAQAKLNRMASAQFKAYSKSVLVQYAQMLKLQIRSGEPLDLDDNSPIKREAELVRALSFQHAAFESLFGTEFFYTNWEEQLLKIQYAYLDQVSRDWDQKGNAVAGATALDTLEQFEGFGDGKKTASRKEFDESRQKIQTIKQQKQEIEARLAQIAELKETGFSPSSKRLLPGERLELRGRLLFNAGLKDETLAAEFGEMLEKVGQLLEKTKDGDALASLADAQYVLDTFSECAIERLAAQDVRAGNAEVNDDISALFADDGSDDIDMDDTQGSGGYAAFIGGARSRSTSCSDAKLLAATPQLVNPSKPDYKNPKSNPDWYLEHYGLHQKRFYLTVIRMISADLYAWQTKHAKAPNTKNVAATFDFNASFEKALERATAWSDGRTEEEKPLKTRFYYEANLTQDEDQSGMTDYIGMRELILKDKVQAPVTFVEGEPVRGEVTPEMYAEIAMDADMDLYGTWMSAAFLGQEFDYAEKNYQAPCDATLQPAPTMKNDYAQGWARSLCDAATVLIPTDGPDGGRFVGENDRGVKANSFFTHSGIQAAYTFKLFSPETDSAKDPLAQFMLRGSAWDAGQQEHARAAEEAKYQDSGRGKAVKRTHSRLDKAAGADL